jgi:ureidoglycolate dehydrogenase (NAD+)
MKESINSMRVFQKDLEKFCIDIMLNVGMDKDSAKSTAEVLATTDSWGIYSHGTRQLRNYIKKLKAGGINPKAVPEVISEGPSWAMLDGNSAMAMVTSCKTMEMAIKKAKTSGLGYAGVKNSTHFGAAAYYVNMAVKEDMIGLAMSNVDTNMTVPGARGSVIGNNPLAYAAPAGEEYPIMLDIAMSKVAASKIYRAQQRNEKIPDGWIVDQDGLPTTDISRYPLVGSLLPFAGHKGYGLSLMVEILAAVLTGAAVTTDVKSWMLDLDKPTDEGHAFLAINVEAIMSVQVFKDRMDKMIRGIKNSPKAKGSERIYLPGEMEWEKREEALKSGIPLPKDVIDTLKGLAEDVALKTDFFD